MGIRIALAGNPNSGKTTLFNALTGSNQYVGNWPGVTVEKKEGKLKGRDDVTIVDLPGIYSLSPYSLEEVVARNYLIGERPDVILNIVDGTNLERNLYLTTQLTELGIPVVIAINMMDVVERNGDRINTAELSKKLGCRIVEISAIKETGILEAANAAVDAVRNGKTVPMHTFSGIVEHALAHIEEAAVHDMPEEQQRWYAVKIFERDDKVLEALKLDADKLAHIDKDIKKVEAILDDDAESIIINERYNYISSIIKSCYKKKNAGKLTYSDKIDRIVTSRVLGLPIFAAVMFLVYYISMVTIGAAATDWANEQLFGDGWYLFGTEIWVPGIPALLSNGLEAVGAAEWLNGLIVDGIVAGVGAVLGFVPQMLVLFLLLALLEACGYMSRIAFILDRLFRKFGLSGKSFIPMLIGVGCGVPGVMASRTIENERDRRMTVMTTTFMPCSAKVPFISMIAAAIFGGSALVATSAYFVGMAAIVVSGIILKKTRMFAGDPAPFVMELPPYYMPPFKSVVRTTLDRGWSFIKKAGTIIMLSSVLIWFTSYFGFIDGTFRMLAEEEINHSILAAAGGAIAWIFKPLGWGNWQSAVASITGLIAKENIVGSMGVLFGGGDASLNVTLATVFTGVSGYSFLVFNLLCAPCFAAIGAIRGEMNDSKWTWFAIGYQSVFAYAVSLMINQFGSVLTGNTNIIGLVAASVVLVFIIYMLFKPHREPTRLSSKLPNPV